MKESKHKIMRIFKKFWASNLTLALFLGLFVNVGFVSSAETLDTDGLVTNGTVYDTATYGTTTYVGGSFSYIGPNTGTGVPIKTSTGAAATSYSKVNRDVNAVISDGAGGWYVGGDFTSISGVSKKNLAHIDAAGDVDATFSPEPNYPVQSLLLDGSALYVGGSFSSIGGASYSYLASVDTTTGTANVWDAQADSTVYDMALDGTTLYLGGTFTNVGGAYRSKAAAIDTATALATTWNPYVQGTVYSIALDGTYAYLGGSFWSVSSVSVSNLASYSLAGSLSSWTPNPTSAVNDLIIDGTTLYVAGSFTSIDSTTRNGLASFDTGTGIVNSWDPSVTGGSSGINEISLFGSTLYLGGDFTTVGSNTRYNVAAVDTSTGAATSFDPYAGGTVNSVAISGDGVYLYVGGTFRSIGSGTARKVGLAAFNNSTNSVLGFDANVSGGSAAIYDLALSNDGATLYAGGSYTVIDGSSREDLAAIDTASGTLVSGFNAYIASSSYVYSLLLSGTTLYVGGNFNTLATSTRHSLAAVSASTGAVTSFDPNVTGGFFAYVYDLVLDGTTLYVGGNFTAIGSSSRSHLAAVDTSTGLATSWDPNVTGMAYSTYINAIALSGSNIVIGGRFTGAGGESRSNVAAIDTSTGLATSWDPGTDSTVQAVAVNSSTAYIGGDFATAGGSSRARVAGIDLTTGLATSWDPGANNTVYSLALATGHLFVGGNFGVFDSVPMFYFGHYTMPSNNAPSVTISSAIPRTDGSGVVDIAAVAADTDGDDTVQLKVNYLEGSDCSSATSVATLSETDENTTATYGDPNVENDNGYQIGTSDGYITTSSGDNTVNFEWDTMTDLPSVDAATYCLRVTPYDGTDAGTAATTTLTVDNVVNVPGSVALSAVSTSQVNVSWGDNSNPTGTEYYAENTTAATNSGWVTDLSWSSTGLTCGTSYSFQVKARNQGSVETSFVSGSSVSTLACPVADVPGGGSSILIYNLSRYKSDDEPVVKEDDEEDVSEEEPVVSETPDGDFDSSGNAIEIVTGLEIVNQSDKSLGNGYSDAKKIEAAMSNVKDILLDKERVNYDLLIEADLAQVADNQGGGIAADEVPMSEEQIYAEQKKVQVEEALNMLSEQKTVDFGKLSDAERVVEDKVDTQIRDKIYELANNGTGAESFKLKVGDKEMVVGPKTKVYVTFDKRKAKLMQEEVDKTGEDKIIIGPYTVFNDSGVAAPLLVLAGGQIDDPKASEKYYFGGFEGLGKATVQYPTKPEFTNDLEGKTVGKNALFWVGTPEPGMQLNMFAVEKVDPKNKSSWKVSQLGKVSSDDGNKVAVNIDFEKDLPNVDFKGGAKKMYFVIQDEKGKGSVVDMNVDFEQQLDLKGVNLSTELVTFEDSASITEPMGRPLLDGITQPMGFDESSLFTSVLLAQADSVRERTLVGEGMANVKYMTGYAVPGSTVVVTWKSLTYSSVVIADASEGYFEVAIPEVLDAGDHEALVYIYNDSKNLISNITSLLFGKGRAES